MHGPGKERISKKTLPHVVDFVERIGREKNGWGERGDKGLLYRGFNVWELYCKKENDELFERLIKNDEEITQCGACFHCESEQRRKCEDARLEPRERKAPRRTVDCQEVYLGYDPNEDMFLTGWDVFGSDTTGSVLIAFKINEKGEFKRYDYHDCEYDRDRTDMEIYDANDQLFYTVKKKCKRTDPGGNTRELECSGIYYLMTHSRRPDSFELLDIRLD